MTDQSMSSERLTFCNDCGYLRLRDVTNQLQELFTTRTVNPDLCGICNRSVKNENIQQLDTSDSVVQEKQANNQERGQRIGTNSDNNKSGNDGSGREGCDEQSNVENVHISSTDASVAYAGEGKTESRVVSIEKEGLRTIKSIDDVTVSQVIDTATSIGAGECKSDASESTKLTAVRQPTSTSKLASSVDKECIIFDAEIIPCESGKPIISSTGFLEVMNDQSLSRADKNDNTEEAGEEEEMTTAENDDDDDKDGDDDGDGENVLDDHSYAGNIQKTNDSYVDNDFSKYVVNRKDSNSRPKRAPNGKERNNTIDVLDPALQLLVLMGDNPKKPFKCTLCSGIFKFIGRLYKHLVNCHGNEAPKIDRPFHCLVCGKVFSKLNRLSQHSVLHTNVTYKCDHENCTFTSTTKDILIRHIQVHKDQCQKNLISSGSSLKKSSKEPSKAKVKQLKRARKYKIRCGYCPYTCAKLYKMKDHQMRVHWEKTENSMECVKCNSLFTMKVKLTCHIRSNACGLWPTKPEYYLNNTVIGMMGVAKHSDMPFKCKQCTRAEFRTVVEFLEHHKEKHATLNPDIDSIMASAFRCSECNQMFSNQNRLTSHMSDHGTTEPPYRCNHPDCDEKFTSMIHLKTHRKTHEPLCTYMCNFCDVCTETNDSLVKHQLEEHKEMVQRKKYTANKVNITHSCPYCKQTFSRKKELENHLKDDHGIKRPFPCQLCSKAYRDRKSLDEHISGIHTGEKRYLCSLCGLGFTTAGRLHWHSKSAHLKRKPHVCQQCEKRFLTKVSRDIHIQRVHLKLKPFLCKKCGQAFGGKSDLTKHMVYHTGEKPYKCDQCKYECVRVDYLRKHKRTHEKREKKSHQCELCSMTFADDKSLSDHTNQQHPESVLVHPVTGYGVF